MKTQPKGQTQFREIRTDAKTSLFVSEQGGDYAKSMKDLAENNLRPLTYQEALARSSELIKELPGKWFYLDGKGIKEDGIYTFTEKGELAKLTGKETLDRRVRVWKGNQPLSLTVYSGGFEQYDMRRFRLGGKVSRGQQVVVGIRGARKELQPKQKEKPLKQ